MKIIIVILGLVGSCSMYAQSLQLNGRLLGESNKPMVRAHIQIFEFGDIKADTTIETSSGGAFDIKLKNTGAFIVRFCGVDHQPLELPIIVNKAMREELNVSLTGFDVPRRDSAFLIGTFNNFNLHSGIPYSKPPREGAKPPSANEDDFYQLVIWGGGRHSLASISSSKSPESFKLLDNGTYATRLFHPSDKANSEPGVAPRFTAPRYQFKNPLLQHQAEIFRTMQIFKRSYHDSLDAFTAQLQKNSGQGAQLDVDKFQSSIKLEAEVERVANLLRTETDEVSTQMLYINYLSLPSKFRSHSLMERALVAIPPSSPLWGLDIENLYTALNARQRETKEQYINDILSTNQSANVVATVAYSELVQAYTAGDMQRARELYKLLTKRFPAHPLATAARYYYNPDAKIRVGNKLPTFTIASAAKSAKLSDELMRESYYVLELVRGTVAKDSEARERVSNSLMLYKQLPLRCATLLLDAEVPPDAESSKTWSFYRATGDDAKKLAETLELVESRWYVLVSPDRTILASSRKPDFSTLDTALSQKSSDK